MVCRLRRWTTARGRLRGGTEPGSTLPRPGPREGALGRPFGWTAGRTLFTWFASLGLDEEAFRSRVYIAAVCRCFPGKATGGGDRVPNPTEIAACAAWMDAELDVLDPELILPIGRLAISRFLPSAPLDRIIGRVHRVEVGGRVRDVLPLPHPSGASIGVSTGGVSP